MTRPHRDHSIAKLKNARLMSSLTSPVTPRTNAIRGITTSRPLTSSLYSRLKSARDKLD